MSNSVLSLVGFLILGVGLLLMLFGSSIPLAFKDWSKRKRVAFRILIACVLLLGMAIVKYSRNL